MARIRADYVFGTTAAALSSSDTTISSAELTRLPAVTGSDVAALTIHDAATGAYEIVHVTAHAAAATTATIIRAREGSTAAAWTSGSTWTHGPTANDLAFASGVQSVVAGANVTVDSTDPANPVVSASASGGSSGGATELLKPATPTDDFAGSSLSGWNLAGSYTSGDYTVHDSLLDVNVLRGGGSHFWRAAPAGDFSVTAKITVQGDGGNLMFGVLALDTSSNGVGGGIYNASPDGPFISPISGGGYPGGGFQNGNLPRGSLVAQGVPTWFRLRKVGTTYTASLSLNGLTWGKETPSITHAATIARVGFGTWSGNVERLVVEWFDAS